MSGTNRGLTTTQDEFFKALRDEPSCLAELIHPIAALSAQDCIEVYRRGYRARLTETLGETFEATWWVLGDDDFLSLAGRFTSENVSQTYDLSEYGNEFPEFLSQTPVFEEIPFIADLARFEWVFKTIFHKKNLPSQTVDWHAVSADQSEIRLSLSPSALLVSSQYSVYEIWRRRDQNIGVLESFDWSIEEPLIVYKRDSQVFVKRLDLTTFSLMKGLASGLSLEDAIQRRLEEVGPQLKPEDIQTAFTLIAQLGVFFPVDALGAKGSMGERGK